MHFQKSANDLVDLYASCGDFAKSGYPPPHRFSVKRNSNEEEEKCKLPFFETVWKLQVGERFNFYLQRMRGDFDLSFSRENEIYAGMSRNSLIGW